MLKKRIKKKSRVIFPPEVFGCCLVVPVTLELTVPRLTSACFHSYMKASSTFDV